MVPVGGIVVLSGADGSGKTTVLRMLSPYLSRRTSVSTSWLRGSHLHVSLLYRLLSRFAVFKGLDNPYYKTHTPPPLRRVFSILEFAGVLPFLLSRRLLSLFYRVVLCDRGVLDFIVWVVATLRYPEFLGTIYGRFLLRLAVGEKPIYLYADLETLARRADVPRSFLARELAVYNTLAKYVSNCRVDTGLQGPREVLKGVLACMGEASL